jgi:VanZ family protein
LTDELHQSFVPGRSADPLDVLADCAGALLGIALWHGAGRWRRWRQSHAA